jgi:hypothetical protein
MEALGNAVVVVGQYLYGIGEATVTGVGSVIKAIFLGLGA